MHESQILDTIDSLTLNTFTDNEKAIILAHVISENNHIKTAHNLSKIILSKIEDFTKGEYNETPNITNYFQNFHETQAYPKPFEIINKDEIDKFLDKMTDKNFEGDYFNDVYPFYHPIENMAAEGVPRSRSDFIIKT